MEKCEINEFTKKELPDELHTSFATAIAPHLRKFYESDVGKAYFKEWLKEHPEYDEKESAQSTNKEG